MQKYFTGSIQFYRAGYKMHAKFGGSSEPQCFTGFI